MKDSFILYNSFYEPIKELKNEQLGKLLRAIFDYTINGEITQDNDILIAFMFIKNQIDIDTRKWEDTKEKRKYAGMLGGIQKAINNKQELSSKSKQNLDMLNNAKQSQANQAVNVNENDNVNVNDKYIYYEDKKLNDIFKEFLQVRKKLKAVNSDRAIKMLINKLSNYDDDTKYKMIEQSIVHSWKDIYELKEQKKDVPNWFDKEIEKSKGLETEEERKLYEELTRGNKK